MKTYKSITVIEGHLSSFISNYINSLREGKGFEHFTDETILFALLEYSNHPRNMNKTERLYYLYGKCGEFTGVNREITITYDDNGSFVITENNKDLWT